MENGVLNKIIHFFIFTISLSIWSEEYTKETWFGDPGEELGWDWAGEDVVITSDGSALIAVDNASFGFLKTTPLETP